MNRNRQIYIHRTLYHYAGYLRDRRATQGQYPASPIADVGKPVTGERGQLKRRSSHAPQVIQPHSTKPQGKSRVLTGRIDRELELVDSVIISQPEITKKVFLCLYYLNMPFRETSEITRLSSRQVGQNKHQLFEGLDVVI